MGRDITSADSAANGASFTINRAGVYFVFYMDASGSAGSFAGISINGTALTTSMSTPVTFAQGGRGFVQEAINIPAVYQNTFYLAANDVVRPQTNGGNDVTNETCQFNIIRIR